MTTRQRDDFPLALKRALSERVGGFCSNPSCRATTSGPHQNPSKRTNIGVAAHITAAAPGGPRFDPNLTEDQRKGPDNAVWLCQNCAKTIDADPDIHPVSLLREWKLKAEASARLQLGRTHPAAVATDSAMSHISSRSALTEAVQHVLQEEKRRLESMDDRVRVGIQWGASGPIYTLSAAKDFSIRLGFCPESPTDAARHLDELTAFGRTAELRVYGMQVKGSPVFDEMLSDARSGKLLVGSVHSWPAGIRLSTVGANGHQSADPITLNATLTAGRKGLALDGVPERIPIFMKCSLTPAPENRSANVTYTLDFDEAAWQGMPILDLPDFDSIRTLVECMSHGHDVSVDYWADERRFGGGVIGGGEHVEWAQSVLGWLNFVSDMRFIFARIGQNPRLPPREEITKRDIEESEVVACLYRENKIVRTQKGLTISSTFLRNNADSDAWKAQIAPSGMLRAEHDNMKFTVLGVDFVFTKVIHTWTQTRLLTDLDSNELEVDGEIKLTWELQEDGQWITEAEE